MSTVKRVAPQKLRRADRRAHRITVRKIFGGAPPGLAFRTALSNGAARTGTFRRSECEAIDAPKTATFQIAGFEPVNRVPVFRSQGQNAVDLAHQKEQRLNRIQPDGVQRFFEVLTLDARNCPVFILIERFWSVERNIQWRRRLIALTDDLTDTRSNFNQPGPTRCSTRAHRQRARRAPPQERRSFE